MLALTDDDMASSAATAIITYPAFPSAGFAATARAVSPFSMTSSTVRVPKTPMAMSTYSAVVMPSARYMALGRFRPGFGRSSPAKVTTVKPR